MTGRVHEFTIEGLYLPETLTGVGSEEFRELCAALDAVTQGIWGNMDRKSSARARLAGWRETPYWATRNLVARIDGAIVGHASCELPLQDNKDSAWLRVDVLEQYRGRGIGAALLRAAEDVALKKGRHLLQTETEHPGSIQGPELLAPVTGIGGLPRDGEEVAFCLRNGYSLEQVSRFSTLEVNRGLNGPEWDRLEQAAKGKAADYEVLCWTNRCPDEYVDQMAVLMGRMSTDTPAGGLEIEEEDWDATRVRQREQTSLDAGRSALIAVASHRGTGALAAYTVLYLDPEKPWIAEQDDTLVAQAHRGNRLGMLVKVANLRRLIAEYPAVQRVMTFNAEENEHMLAINVQLGFRAAGYDGEWQKRIK